MNHENDVMPVLMGIQESQKLLMRKSVLLFKPEGKKSQIK
jgi:hypothetical protein